MNAGWRYQHIAQDAARLSQKFESISHLNSIEAELKATKLDNLGTELDTTAKLE